MQDGEVQLAAAGDAEDVGVVGVLDAQRHVGQQLALQALAQIWRLVTNLPSWPASGEVLTWKFMVSVGSSTRSSGSASGFSGSAKVSPMATSSMPVTETMSPAARLVQLDPLEALEAQHLADLRACAARLSARA